jgi:cytochrome c biogenesis protein CcdA
MKKIFAAIIIFCTALVCFINYTGDKTRNDADDCGEKCGVPEELRNSLNTPLAANIVIDKKIAGGVLPVAVFYSKLCPHCGDALKFISEVKAYQSGAPFANAEIKRYDSLAGKNIKIDFRLYEILDSEENRKLFQAYANEYKAQVTGLPVFFIAEETFESFPEDSGPKLLIDAMLRAQNINTGLNAGKYSVPVLGEIDKEAIFLPAFTVTIGFLDGLNPCAMWVLVFLLGILAYSKSRKRMLIVGVTFVAASGIVYFALMAAWLNLFLVIGFNKIVMLILALIAIIMGLVNLKEIFFFKEGVSLMIPESVKPKIYKKVRAILKEKNLALSLGLTFIFAIFVNIIELACTAGFPAIFTKILADRGEPVLLKYLYMVLYNILYVQPLLIIVLIFAFTMGHFKMQEKHAKILKLISGGLMLSLGLLLLIKPELMVG